MKIKPLGERVNWPVKEDEVSWHRHSDLLKKSHRKAK